MSIRSKYESELKIVFDKLTEMCRAVVEAIERSVTALKQRDESLAKLVIASE